LSDAHRSTVADIFAATPRDGGRHLREAIAQIEAAGRGALVYIAPRGNVRSELDALRAQQNSTPNLPTTSPKAGRAGDLRSASSGSGPRCWSTWVCRRSAS